jgi:hypothetical protein
VASEKLTTSPFKINPIKQGKDSQGFDAILGYPTILKLKMGINNEGHVYLHELKERI